MEYSMTYSHILVLLVKLAVIVALPAAALGKIYPAALDPSEMTLWTVPTDDVTDPETLGP